MSHILSLSPGYPVSTESISSSTFHTIVYCCKFRSLQVTQTSFVIVEETPISNLVRLHVRRSSDIHLHQAISLRIQVPHGRQRL